MKTVKIPKHDFPTIKYGMVIKERDGNYSMSTCFPKKMDP